MRKKGVEKGVFWAKFTVFWAKMGEKRRFFGVEKRSFLLPLGRQADWLSKYLLDAKSPNLLHTNIYIVV